MIRDLMPRRMAIILASIFFLAGTAFLAHATNNFWLGNLPIAVDSLVWGAVSLFLSFVLYMVHIKE